MYMCHRGIYWIRYVIVYSPVARQAFAGQVCCIWNNHTSKGYLHFCSMNWWRRHDLPTPALPITKNLKR